MVSEDDDQRDEVLMLMMRLCGRPKSAPAWRNLFSRRPISAISPLHLISPLQLADEKFEIQNERRAYKRV